MRADVKLDKVIKGTYKPRPKQTIDYHKDKNRKRPSGKQLSKWNRRLIIAWDGEGFTRDNGVHIYNLLANSNNNFISDQNGLSTWKIFQFLLHESNPNAINVIFGGSYDVNMWLKDVPRNSLERLWATGQCFWGEFKITYAHRKKFTVKHWTTKKTFVLWDVLGYFQSTFVDACYKWLGDLPLLEEIQSMKLQRSTFTEQQFAEVVAYNRTECELLVDLVHNLFSAMDEADISLTRYDGAGSIAAFLLRTNNIKDKMGEHHISLQYWAQNAYSGGRIEAPKVGNYEGDVWRRDINSAYPSAAINLPSFEHANWILERKWNGSPYSILKINWNYKKKSPFYPLWYRESTGTILYPKNGCGSYYGVEAQSLFDYYTEGSDFYIEEVYNCYLPEDVEYPFKFILDTYETRLMFKRKGSMASEALKLGMNSIYGKLAQQAGARNGKSPTYHNLLWAGWITASTRRRLYQSAMRSPKKVIAFATDAVISLDPPNDSDVEGTALGEWTIDKLDGCTIVQPGVYWLKKGDEWQAKYRGFDKGTLSRDNILATWEKYNASIPCDTCGEKADHIHATLTRFVGLGGALARREDDFYNHWTRWETTDRRLTIIPTGKRQIDKKVGFAAALCDTLAVEPFDPSANSSKYPISWLDGPQVLRPEENGVDIRIIEEEMLDSYA